VILQPVFAHSWGWDEIAYFAVPVMVALFWVRWIEKRAKARKEAAAQGVAETTPTEETPA
jgi:hypothetical protein